MWLPLTRPLLGTWPTTQACALTGNWTSNLFDLQARAQSIELHQPGPLYRILNLSKIINKTQNIFKKCFLLQFFIAYWIQTCSFSRRSAFCHCWLLLHSWCLKSRMFPPPPKLEINELPHHECLGNANRCQNSNSENIKKIKKILRFIKIVLLDSLSCFGSI